MSFDSKSPLSPVEYPLASIDVAQLEVLVEDVEFPVKSMFTRPGLVHKTDDTVRFTVQTFMHSSCSLLIFGPVARLAKKQIHCVKI